MTRSAADLVGATLGHTLPVLGFLLLVTVASELLDRLGVFQALGRRLLGLAGGRTWLLFVLFVASAVACTSAMSLDATAVLLTPVAIGVARSAGVSEVPFALACVWLANTASLVSPVGNLTTLLASGPGGVAEHLSRTWLPQLVLLAVTVAVVVALYARRLGSPCSVPDGPVPMRPSVRWALGAVGVFAVAVVCGTPAWAAAAVLVLLLLLVAWLVERRPAGLPELLRGAPWAMAAGVAVLFVVTAWVASLLGPGLVAALGPGRSPLELVRVAAVGAVAANAVDNLPAYLVLSGAAPTPEASTALLVGVNAGPLVTPWGSLATLLWLRVCRRHGLRVRPLELFGGGAVVAVLSVLLAAPLA